MSFFVAEMFITWMLDHIQQNGLFKNYWYFQQINMESKKWRFGRWFRFHMSSVKNPRSRWYAENGHKTFKSSRGAGRGSSRKHFCAFFRGSSRKRTLCNHFLHIIHSLDISFLHLNIVAMRNPLMGYFLWMLWSHGLYEISELHVRGI